MIREGSWVWKRLGGEGGETKVVELVVFGLGECRKGSGRRNYKDECDVESLR